MKFTNGYWLIRDNFQMNYATGFLRCAQREDTLTVLASCKPVHGRGDLLNMAALTVTFSAPQPDTIRVKIVHHAGCRINAPKLELNEAAVKPVITETDSWIDYTSGRLTARVHKDRWLVEYLADGETLTSSPDRAMAHARDKTDGKTYMLENLMLDVGENVYGLGEHFGPYVKNGQSIDIWNEDGGTASEQGYKNVPFYMTNRGYGVLVEDTGDVRFEAASEKVERVQFSTRGETLVYDVFYGGTPKKVLERYTALTGRPALPPAWSFGLWLSTSFTTDYDEETATGFIDGMRQREIPFSVFHFDCYWMRGLRWCDFEWDPQTFPDPEGMLRRYHEKGLRLCCWINPYIAQDSPLFAEGLAGGYFLTRTDGSVWQTDLWQAGMAIVDVTHPEARRWYTGYLRRLLEMGIDCFKTDFGERIPVTGIVYHDGSDARLMHNHYSFLYNQMVFDLLREVRGENEAVVFARSAGIGGQRFPVHWGGDNSASYISMAETLRAGLSMSHTGFGFWSHDISGFESTAPADVYKRWVQFGLLSSHSRLHGSGSYRVPWLFDEESCDVVRVFSKLKNRLMPYLYRCAIEAHECGCPMLRPMLMEFPDDPACDTLDRQYMLGGSLLVAPVFRKDGRVSYYLPRGEWVNLLNDEVVRGGRWVEECHDFLSLPLMVRPGTVLPMGREDGRPDYDYLDGVTLHLFGLRNGDTAVVRVPTAEGAIAASFTVCWEGGRASIQTDSDKPYQVVCHHCENQSNR